MVKNDYIDLLLIHPPPPLSNPTNGFRAASLRKQFTHWKEIMDYSENGVPLFNGENGLKYYLWSGRMKVFLHVQGYYIWLSVITIYDSSKRKKDCNQEGIEEE
jgi:hypothetical protein